VQLLDPLAKRQNITLELRPGDLEVLAEIDGPQIQQVLSNIIENALHAMPKGGIVTVHVEAGPFRPLGDARTPGNGFTRIAVEDQGIGISPENLEHIFDPFFTTKEVGKGTGLGLSIAHGIVQDHGGWIEVTSTPGVGSQFLIYIPRVETLPNPQSNAHDGSARRSEAFRVPPNPVETKEAAPSA